MATSEWVAGAECFQLWVQVYAMNKCNGHMRHWFTVRGSVGESAPKCVRCGAPNPRSMQSEIARDPTEFETKVLKRIARGYGYFGGGNKQVHYSAAARRLERLGYAAKPGTSWYVTEKGEQYLASLPEQIKY